ncbi:MAG: hypothetical protein E7099_09775 [Mediterranea massiliensis]|nr:hypothetical protein [Mediterranea massiliensis]
MKTLGTFARQFSLSMILAMSMGSAVVSCDSILDEEAVDCSISYKVKFKYDYNMKYADAFANEVKSVTLYAFDDNGKLVYQKTEEGDVLAQEGYAMNVDMQPGDYQLIAWAGLNDDDSFSVPLVAPGSGIEELQCKMDRIYTRNADNGAIINTRLSSLFHGQVTEHSFTTRAAMEQTVTVPLVKNTNAIKVILHQMDGVAIPAEDFEFTITDNNGLMDYDNSLMEDEQLTYHSYHTEAGFLEEDGQTRAEGAGENNISFATAELTVGRLVENQNATLTIRNKQNDEVILSIPIIKMFLLAKMQGQYNMENQEYLDRQDEYRMTFFLDKTMKWINTQIMINDWIVRFDDLNVK